jgi:peptidylprolyl isomerase
MDHRTARLRVAAALLLAAVASCSPAPDPAPAKPAIPAPPDVAAPPPNSLKTPSGLSTRVLEKGAGQRHPRATDTVVVHYTGWSTDGLMFDSSVQRGEPSEFQLDGVIAGWTEGVQMMVEGEKRRLWIPAHLAYEGQPSKPQGMLVFDIELIDIK